MKKLVLLVALSMLAPAVSAQQDILPNPIPFNYQGKVPRQCAVTNIKTSGLEFTRTNGFETAYKGTGSFDYQTNTRCKGTFSPTLTINSQNQSAYLPVCVFANEQSQVAVEYTPEVTPATVSMSYNNGVKALPAGDYVATCTLTVEFN